jgi:hypothetical protein
VDGSHEPRYRMVEFKNQARGLNVAAGPEVESNQCLQSS